MTELKARQPRDAATPPPRSINAQKQPPVLASGHNAETTSHYGAMINGSQGQGGGGAYANGAAGMNGEHAIDRLLAPQVRERWGVCVCVWSESVVCVCECVSVGYCCLLFVVVSFGRGGGIVW